MPTPHHKKFKSYLFLIILLSATVLGCLTGYLAGPSATKLKPLGDIFLNLMFTVVVPLIFFSVISAIANMGDVKRVGKVISTMFGVFLFTDIIAAVFMIIVVMLFPPAQGVSFTLPKSFTAPPPISVGDQIVGIFTVPDFLQLFSREHILALIFFAILVGLAVVSLGEKAKNLVQLLQTCTEVSMKAVTYVMYYAPIGFFAYFAVLIAELGPKLIATYLYSTIIYFAAAIIYFIVAFSFYAWLAGGKEAIKRYWKNIPLPVMTALATSSSAASIPANLQATKNMGVPDYIYETVVPLGAILHKDGSVLGGILKVAFLFGIFHMDFSGAMVLLIALMIGILVGTVMGAIPSGGMIAEVLILSLYGFPPQALIMIAAISLLIDAPATMLNVNGNSVCSMMVARIIEGKKWLRAANPTGRTPTE